MIHVATRGLSLWIDSFEALAFFGIVATIFHSVVREPRFKTKKSSGIIVSEGENGLENEVGADAVSGGGLAATGEDGASSSSPPQSAFASVTTKVAVKPTFSACFVWFGLFVGFLCWVSFLADVLRFVNWKIFGRLAMAMDGVLGIFFLPIWLLMLAKQLPAATERFEREEKRVSVLLNALEDETAALKGEMS